MTEKSLEQLSREFSADGRPDISKIEEMAKRAVAGNHLTARDYFILQSTVPFGGYEKRSIRSLVDEPQVKMQKPSIGISMVNNLQTRAIKKLVRYKHFQEGEEVRARSPDEYKALGIDFLPWEPQREHILTMAALIRHMEYKGYHNPTIGHVEQKFLELEENHRIFNFPGIGRGRLPLIYKVYKKAGIILPQVLTQ